VIKTQQIATATTPCFAKMTQDAKAAKLELENIAL